MLVGIKILNKVRMAEIENNTMNRIAQNDVIIPIGCFAYF